MVTNNIIFTIDMFTNWILKYHLLVICRYQLSTIFLSMSIFVISSRNKCICKSCRNLTIETLLFL